MAEMIKLGTKCNECALFDGADCKIYVLDAFKEAGATVEIINDETVIDRVCPYKRDEEWVFENKEDLVNKLFYEVFISGTIVVICKNDTSSLDTTLSKIKRMPNNEKFKKIIVHLDNIKRSEILEVTSKYFEDSTVMQVFSGNISENGIDLRAIADESFKRAKNGYMVFINSEKDFEEDMLDKLNIVINQDMKRLLYVPPIDNEVHKMVCMSPLYKFLRGNKMEEIETKIRHMAETAKCDDGIMSWEKIYE